MTGYAPGSACPEDFDKSPFLIHDYSGTYDFFVAVAATLEVRAGIERGWQVTGRERVTIRLDPSDNVVVACAELSPGMEISGEAVICRDRIPPGHKIATGTIREGEPVVKYGQIIGFAARLIGPGEHVHTHNLRVMGFERDYAIAADARPADLVPEDERETFRGIVRADGRIATRNYIAVISTVNCSASVVHGIARRFDAGELAPFPDVDGVVPVTHGWGCGMAASGGGFEHLQRSLAGYARHPNFAGVLMVGLGCEVNRVDSILENEGLERGPLLQTLEIQEVGGTSAAVEMGVELIRQMLPEVSGVERRSVPVSHLIVGLECGGSDAYSGITANPALGAAVDMLVRHGGTAILSETPEVYGAEHLLARRAVSRQVGEKLISLIRRWEEYTAIHGGEMDNNPTPGNKEGGITTILEKSLGAAAKGGTTNLAEVYKYAEPVATKGLVFMDTPGYDPVSVTGMVAGGANIVCFTTGRGSVFGCKPVPVIKLAASSGLYERMKDDMDVNCGIIIDGEATVEEVGEEIFRLILRVASGERTRSELKGIGDFEFVPWQVGAVM